MYLCNFSFVSLGECKRVLLPFDYKLIYLVFRNFPSDQAFVPFSTAICSSPWVWCTFAPSLSLVRTFWRTWLRCVVVFSTHSEASSSETTCYSAPETYCQMMESSQSKQVQLFFISSLIYAIFWTHYQWWLLNKGAAPHEEVSCRP